MPTKLFVNLPVKDLSRSQEFFTGLGFEFFGMAEDMASVIISEHTQVMLLAEPTFASFASKGVADATAQTEVILVLGLERPEQVDDLVEKARAAGASPAGHPAGRPRPVPARFRRPRRSPLGGPVPGGVTDSATSADGTRIAFSRYGAGPAILLVHGTFTDRTHPTLSGVAAALAPWFTVVNYDRRGRGDSGNTTPYAVDREIEDVAALIEAAGGSAMVFGGSSGAALALEAAARIPHISKVAAWEPPYHVDDSAPGLPDDFAARLDALVQACLRGRGRDVHGRGGRDASQRHSRDAARAVLVAGRDRRAHPGL